jgi:hypothetical protein
LLDHFLIRTEIKRGDALMPLLFNFDLQFAIMNAQETQTMLNLKGTHQLLAYADDINLLEDNIYAIKKHTETLIDASREVGLEVNAEKTKYMLLSRLYIKLANRSSENVAQFQYLGTTATNQN